MARPDKPNPQRAQAALSTSPQPVLTQLSSEDGEVLDSLLAARASDSQAGTSILNLSLSGNETDSGPDPQRVEKVTAVLGLLDRFTVDPPPSDLLERTASRVRESKQRRRFASQIATLSPPTTAFRLGDLVSVAAAVFIAAVLALPMLARSDADSKQIACASHQATAGRALQHYAAANQQTLPRGTVRPNSVWYRVGPDSIDKDGNFQSNSAHLRLLVRHGFIHPNTLSCPGSNEAPTDTSLDAPDFPTYNQVDLSYLSQFGPVSIRIDRSPHTPVLADKNPQFEVRILANGKRQLHRRKVLPDAPSTRHDGAGQNLLFKSGAVVWTTKPMAGNNDNIFLMNGVNQYQGTETPEDPDSDIFLTP